MLRIIMGRAGSGKTGRIMSEIKTHIENGEGGIILVVPEQYSHDAERLLCESCGDSASMYAQVLSFTRMCARVFAEQGGGADTYLDDAGKFLVMSRAIELSADHTRVYGRLSKKSEFISKLTATAKEFRSSKITISDILEVSSKSRPALKDKLTDLALILEIYRGLLKNDVRDPDERLDKLAEMLPDGNFAKNSYIWFDGFYDFTAQQFCIIEVLAKMAKDITICLNCDDLNSDDILFEHSRNTVKNLIKLAEKLHIECEILELSDSMKDCPDELRFLEKNLFSHNPETFDGECSAVSAFVCSNPTEECELAAAKAIELVQNGARWQDIAVAAGDYDAYAAVIESVFKKYNVPVYQNTKLDILQMPPVLAITSAIKTISDGWSYEDIFTYLKTGFADISREECDILENYVMMWNIRGSLWYRDEPWTFSQDGYKGAAEDNILNQLNNIRNKVTAPLKTLQENMKSAAINKDRLSAIVDFIEQISLYRQIEERAEALIANSDRYMADSYYNLGEIITTAIEQLYNVAGDFSVTLDEFAYQLQLLLSQYDIGVIPTSVDSVSVGAVSRLRKRNVKHLFVLGMTEGSIPQISESDGVFSDAERDELISMNLSLAQTSIQRLYGDITSVYDIITMPSDTLTVMYPTGDSAGSTNKPSYIFENILNLLGIIPNSPKQGDYKIFSKIPCREFAAISKSTDSTAAAAAEYFSEDKDFKDLLEVLSDISQLQRKYLSPEHAKKLYGDKVTMTASRVDKYNSCRYAYFLQYGLKAKPRTKAEFDASVIGTFIHYLLENVTREVESLGGFAVVDDNECTQITRKYVAEFVENDLQNMKDKTVRFKYLFDSLTEDAVSVVLNMASELRSSDFRPLDFELDFSYDGELPPYEVKNDNTSLAVRGVVDRVDGWVHDGKLYIRVVDYKTGIKSFSLSDVWYGMGMQMLIYLFALKSMGKQRYDMDVVPAGVLYAPAREVLLSESRYVTDSELEKNRVKNLKRSGLILNDETVIEAMEHGDSKIYLPIKTAKDGSFTGDSLASAEQLGILAKHIDKVLLDISKEIFSGDVSADPYYRSQIDNSCMYCDYFHACHYSESRDGKYRELTKLKSPDVWLNLQKEAEDE